MIRLELNSYLQKLGSTMEDSIYNPSLGDQTLNIQEIIPIQPNLVFGLFCPDDFL